MIRYNEIHDINWVISKFMNTSCISRYVIYRTYHVNKHYHLVRKLYILHLYCLAKLRKVHINNLLLGIRKLKVQVEKCFQILWLRPFCSTAFMSNRKNKCICLWEILARLTSFIFAKRVYTFCESLIVADSDNDILQNNTVRYIRSICW